MVLRLKTKFAPLLTYLGTPYFAPILPRHLYEGTDVLTSEWNAKPVGTGPFVFEEWRRGQYIKLRKNLSYFKTGLPRLDAAVIQIMPDEATRLRALEKGEIDMAVLIPNNVLQKYEAQPDLTVTAETWKSFASVGWIFVNLRSPIVGGLTKGRLVRRALYHTIDRKAILEKVYFGAGQVATGPFHSAHPFALKSGLTTPNFVLPRAEKLLDEAGYPRKADGVRFRLNMPLTVSRAEFSRVPELWREDLKTVGIDLNLIPGDDTAFLDRTFKQWDFDVFYTTPYTGPDPSVSAARFYTSSNIKKAPFTNAGGYSNPKVDELFQRAQTEVAGRAPAPVRGDPETFTRTFPVRGLLSSSGTMPTAPVQGVGLSPFRDRRFREQVDLR